MRSFLRQRQSPTPVNEALLDALAETVLDPRYGDADLYLAALEHCREKLNPTDEELLGLRYADNLGSREIADRLHRPQQGVCHSLKRIRRWLLDCIKIELARHEHSEKRV